MSVIAGLVAGEHTAGTGAVDAMLERLASFTPDASGAWAEGRAALGQALLAITPEDRHERQPLLGADARFVLTADARLDNRVELLQRFRLRPSDAAQIPDSALILRAFLEWGPDCPGHLLGDFAFAVWDAREQRLFCARDHMGMRPFYYHHSGRSFAFASAIKGLLALPDVPGKLDETALANMMALLEENLEDTLYQGIRRLPPGHSLRLEADGRVRLSRYWALDPERELRLGSDAEYAEAVREALTRAVAGRLRCRHPNAVMLSGGLDSSSIACLAARELVGRGQRLTAVCSVLPEDFTGPEADERAFMRSVAARETNLDLVPVTAAGATPLTGLDAALATQDGPFRDLFHYMTHALLGAARERGARNLLWGFGGDHLVSSSGKGYMVELLRTGRWRTLTREVRAHAKVNRRPWWAVVRGRVLAPFLPQWCDDVYRRLHGRAPERWLDQFAIHPDFVRRTDLIERLRAHGMYYGSERYKSARQGEYRNLTSGSSTRVMEYIAHAGHALGMAVHTPLFDKNLVELCLAMPPEQKTSGGWGRLLLRRSMDGILPPEIQWRTDKGPFTPDFERRITAARGEFMARIEQLERDPGIAGYFDLPKMHRIMAARPEYQTGFRQQMDTATAVVLPLMIARWLRRSFDPSIRKSK